MDSSTDAYEEDTTSTIDTLFEAEREPALAPLPLDVWVLLSSMLDLRDVVSCSSVCRTWRKLLAQGVSLFILLF
jgi:hypothetical protein